MKKIRNWTVAVIALVGYNHFFGGSDDGTALEGNGFYNSLDSDVQYAGLGGGTTPPVSVPANAPKPLNGTNTSFDCRSFPVDVRVPADLPEDTLQALLCAEAIFTTPFAISSGVSAIECNHGRGKANDVNRPDKTCRDPGTRNGARAAGPGQFLPCNWDNSNAVGKCWDGNRPEMFGQWGELREPAAERGVPGYGVDCDGDSIANPWSVYDAACASARYLKSIHGSNGKGDWHRTLAIYNGGGNGPNIPGANRYAEMCLSRGQAIAAAISR